LIGLSAAFRRWRPERRNDGGGGQRQVRRAGMEVGWTVQGHVQRSVGCRDRFLGSDPASASLLTAEARIVHELNRWQSDSGIVRAEHRHGTAGIAPSARAMMHPVHVLRLAHVLMTRDAAALSTAATFSFANGCTRPIASPQGGPSARSRSAAKGIGRFRPPPRSGRAMRREAGGGHGRLPPACPATSAACEPVRASLAAGCPKAAKPEH